LCLGLALDEAPPGWRIADPKQVRPITAALRRGEPVSLVTETAAAGWLHTNEIGWAERAERRVLVTSRQSTEQRTVIHPLVLALGIGCERDCSAAEIADLAHATLAEEGYSGISTRPLSPSSGKSAG
jgi:cobalt-precorrin 5A hydrolase/precorrin-3B C17-methyltransferase